MYRQFCRSIKFNDKESAIIGAEIAKLLDKGVVVESAPSEGDFISPVFLRLKKNGIDYRMILNLKELNKFVVYQHFKMDSLKCVTSLMTQGCYMASVDTSDSYYNVPVALEHQKCLHGRTNCINTLAYLIAWHQRQKSLLSS